MGIVYNPQQNTAPIENATFTWHIVLFQHFYKSKDLSNLKYLIYFLLIGHLGAVEKNIL